MFIKRKYHLNNVFHCTVHKAGSQWIKKMLMDPIVVKITAWNHFQYQELLPDGFDPRDVDKRNFFLPFPARSFCSPLYISPENYLRIPKLGLTKCFFISREPKDLLISYYFSLKESHPIMGGIAENRKLINQMSIEDGLIYVIDHLEKTGYWKVLKSWDNFNDPTVLKLRYADLINNADVCFGSLFDYLEIDLSFKKMNKLLDKYSFKSMTGGREVGQYQQGVHLRSGGEGNWKEFWSSKVDSHFEVVYGTV